MQEHTYDTNIEATLLSSIIYNPALLEKYASKINRNLFFLPFHQSIIDIILKLFEAEKLIDEEIIKNKLGPQFEDDLIYILTKNPISALDDYLEILQDYSMKRDMQTLAYDITKSLHSNVSGLELQAKVTNLTEKIRSSNKLELLEINNIANIEDKEVEYICKAWLPVPVRTVSLITAPGGTGKSWLVLQLALRAIEEGKIKKAFLWLSEDPKEISDQRKVEVSPLFSHFKAKLQDYDLIILDPLIAFYGTDENNNSSARRFMQLFTDWANKENKTIIFIHHSTKNTTQSRGASAFVDAVRTVYEIDKIRDKDGNEKDTHKRLIKLTKDNYGIGTFLDSYCVERELFPLKVKHEEINYKEESLSFGIPNDF